MRVVFQENQEADPVGDNCAVEASKDAFGIEEASTCFGSYLVFNPTEQVRF